MATRRRADLRERFGRHAIDVETSNIDIVRTFLEAFAEIGVALIELREAVDRLERTVKDKPAGWRPW